MISIEVEGKTPEEAIQKALEVLDTTRERVKIEILDEGSKGLFGMIGNKQAKVRATLLESDALESESPTPASFSPRSTVTAVKPPRPITGEKGKPPAADQTGKEVLEDLLRLMGFAATIDETITDDKVHLVIEAGEDSNILIGKRGKNLNGLQYIVNRICGRKYENARPVIIDIEGYRQRRKEALEAMARRLAAKAKSSRREVDTEPLSAADRRLIHITLKEDSDVFTQSRGEGAYKNVVIKPRSK